MFVGATAPSTSAPTQSSSTFFPTQSSLISPEAGNKTTLSPSATIQSSSSTSVALTPTTSAAPNATIGKPAIIVLGILLPLVLILIAVATWYCIKSRRNKSPHTEPKTSAQRWITTTVRPFKKQSVNELPPQTAPEEHERNKYAQYRTAPLSAGASSSAVLSSPLVPLIPPSSPFHSRPGVPPRLPRPASLSLSTAGVTHAASPCHYADSTNSAHDGIGPGHSRTRGARSDSQSEDDIPLAGLPVYDGTRRVFYETALSRSLPFDRLARPSLRADTPGGLERHNSLTPQPLRIVKKASLMDTTVEMRGGREEVPSGSPTDALRRGSQTDYSDANSWAFVTRHAMRTFGPDSVNEGDPINDVAIDEEERLRQRQATLNYLNGVLPTSPPTNYRASSVYSREQ